MTEGMFLIINLYISIGLLFSILSVVTTQRDQHVNEEIADQVEQAGMSFWMKLIAVTALFWLPALLFGFKTNKRG